MSFIFNLLSYFKAPLPKSNINPLEGKALRYLIGINLPPAKKEDNVVHVVSYDCSSRVDEDTIAYCNLFDEYNTGKYGPYLYTSDTAEAYSEGQIDPSGPGWKKNLITQFNLRKKDGFRFIELDNPDAYDWNSVKSAIDLAASMELKVIAKNPDLLDEAERFLSHPNVFAAIVERGAGDPWSMHKYRIAVGKPNLPVWFVSFGSSGKSWASKQADVIRYKELKNMGVTYSPNGEYTSVVDIIKPNEFIL